MKIISAIFLILFLLNCNSKKEETQVQPNSNKCYLSKIIRLPSKDYTTITYDDKNLPINVTKYFADGNLVNTSNIEYSNFKPTKYTRKYPLSNRSVEIIIDWRNENMLIIEQKGSIYFLRINLSTEGNPISVSEVKSKNEITEIDPYLIKYNQSNNVIENPYGVVANFDDKSSPFLQNLNTWRILHIIDSWFCCRTYIRFDEPIFPSPNNPQAVCWDCNADKIVNNVTYQYNAENYVIKATYKDGQTLNYEYDCK